MSDDIVIAVEYPVGEPILAKVLPNVFNRCPAGDCASIDERGIEFGGSWRQRYQRNVAGDIQPVCCVPSGPIQDEYGVTPWIDRPTDFLKMRLHRGRIAERHDQSGPLAFGGTDCPKYIRRCGPLIERCPGTGSASGPTSRDAVLLADPGLIRKPNLYIGTLREVLSDFIQTYGEVF